MKTSGTREINILIENCDNCSYIPHNFPWKLKGQVVDYRGLSKSGAFLPVFIVCSKCKGTGEISVDNLPDLELE